ncbi:hypothetical protein [Phyllobacterium sophorae]|uniref:hypothetical protein n=1 Tax=Phyllobacterium sophorae TaxID=1520277 RepID=UPI001AECCE47|nr:hypothetical protein [Phyllobacterium sophorae]
MKELKPGDFCPLIKGDCLGLKCNWFTQIRGTNPNTGEPVDHWGCAVAWLPTLLIENAQQSRQQGAAIESFRNEMVKANEVNQNLQIMQLQQMAKEDAHGSLPKPLVDITPVVDIDDEDFLIRK